MAEAEDKAAGGRIMVRVTLSLIRHLKFDRVTLSLIVPP
jgi:hypothetical protein